MSPSVVEQFPVMQLDYLACVGGLDQKTPTLQVPPGRAIVRYGVNFEVAATPGGGYTRVGGYERFDGRPKPSDATYQVLQLATVLLTPSPGAVVTGQTSGATAVLIAVAVAQTPPYVVGTKVNGTFQIGETLMMGTQALGVLAQQTVTIGAKTNAQYLNLAADVYRADIAAVPGSGPVRGVVSFTVGGAHKVYAFRDNVGGTACLLYQASASGWTAVSLLWEVRFTGGTGTEPADGAILTQGAVTAMIRRTVTQTGSWAAGTATGRFIVDAPTGGSFTTGTASSGSSICTLSGAEQAISFLPGGRFVFVVQNFGGQLATTRLYGCDGVNRAFEFDGTVLVPIETGASTDVPSQIQVHRHHLFLAIGSSCVISGPGLPYRFTALDGGAELATGDLITGFASLPGAQGNAALLIDCRHRKYILYGTAAGGSQPWTLVDFNNATGGVPYSQQILRDAYSLNEAGVQSLTASAELAGFSAATLTFGLQDWMDERRGRLRASTVHRSKNQYRLYFNDGSALYLTLVNGTFLGALPQQFLQPVFCAWSDETPGGTVVTYVGADNGFVYELDRGSSFDGEPIDALLQLVFATSRTPRLLKSYRRLSLEVSGTFYAEIQVSATMGYGQAAYVQPGQRTYASGLQGLPFWDQAVWDRFTWDGVTLIPLQVEIAATAENIQLQLGSTTDYIYPYTITSIILHYLPRRLLR